jgi:Ca-activated chloride channel family protein
MMRKLFAFLVVTLSGFPLSALNVSVAQLDASRLLLSQQVDAYVSVTDAEGGPVEGLPQSAFRVEESSDGVHYAPVREITGFTADAGTANGITFMLLIDNSGSMYDTIEGKPTADPALMRITHAKAAVRTFLAAMTNPADRVGLAAFNTFFTVLARPTASRDSIGGLLEQIKRPTSDEAYTELYASLALAAREFAGVRGRKAIIVLSDGENFPFFSHSGRLHPVFQSRLSEPAEPILAGQQEGVSIYGISFGPEKDKSLQGIAVDTGGKLFDAANAQELTGAYEAIHRQVAGEYRISYRAGTDPAEKRYVRVSVDTSGAKAAAARFYFASTVFGLPVDRLTPLFVIPFLLAIALLWLITRLKLERKSRPANLEVLQTRVGRPSTRVLPLSTSRTIIGGGQKADLTIAGAPQMREEHATILFDPRDKSYTVVGGGDLLVNNQPARTRKLEAGDVIDVGGATIVFDEPGQEKKEKKK